MCRIVLQFICTVDRKGGLKVTGEKEFIIDQRAEWLSGLSGEIVAAGVAMQHAG